METKTIAEGTYLGLYQRNGWEFIDRPNATGVVGILPITEDGQIVLVEQFRIPVDKQVIEIPAGLVGDEKEFTDESLAECAARELLEETGYHAETITLLISSPTSAGMTSEMTHLFAATGLTRQHMGGGTKAEDIVVHHVPLTKIEPWLSEQQRENKLVDFKIFTSLQVAAAHGVISAQASC